MLQIRAFASGRVQGVNFRYYVYRKARQLGLKGYVCNLDDGRVEILAQGSRDDIENLIAKGDLGGFRISY
jgi:acylphosphatase